MCTYDWNIEKISCNKLLFRQCEFIPKTNVIMPIISIAILRIDKSPSHLQATSSGVLDQQKDVSARASFPCRRILFHYTTSQNNVQFEASFTIFLTLASGVLKPKQNM